jgi:hypothetical protein
MRNGVVAVLVVLVIALGVGTGYLVGASNQRTTTSVSITTVTTSITTVTTSITAASTAYANKSSVFVMNVNGSFYYADDISSDVVVQNPGYAYFRNASVTFDGVKFVAICPQGYSGCPVPSGNTTTQTVTQILISVYKFNMTFPDSTTETTLGFIGDATYTFALSNHVSPRAGMLIEYIEYNYPNNLSGNGPYHTFLLVSS